MNTLLTRHCVALLATCLVAACSSAPEPVLYTLEPSLTGRDSQRDGPRISLAEVELPAYARSNLIASADGPNKIRLDDDHRWASVPSESITSALAQQLEAALDGTVLVQPHPRRFRPTLAIRVNFDRLLRTERGAAELSGRAIISVDASESIEIVRFAVVGAATGADYAAYMASVQAALEEIASRIADRVTSLPAT
ncbi:MAG: ABC-type transport auxiliary lipoprotein family protein [Pseudomonadota bacterium]